MRTQPKQKSLQARIALLATFIAGVLAVLVTYAAASISIPPANETLEQTENANGAAPHPYISGTLAVPDPPPCNPAWLVEASPNIGGKDNYLNAISAVSANDVWSVGYYWTGQYDLTLTEWWDGTAWNLVPGQDPGLDNVLSGVAAVSHSDVWAVGHYNAGIADKTLIIHWDGGAWRYVPSPNVGTSTTPNVLNAVTVTSANDIWAVGYYTTSLGKRTLIEHWDGTSWSVVSSDNPSSADNMLNAVESVVPGDVWAVGAVSNGTRMLTTIQHWNGTGWITYLTGNFGDGDNVLNGISAAGPSEVWAVGYYTKGTYQQTLIERWDGTSWTASTAADVGSDSNRLRAVVAVGQADVWAVGDYVSGTTVESLIEHWNGLAWSVVASPDPSADGNYLTGLAAVSSTDIWASGYYLNFVNQTLVEHYLPCPPPPTPTLTPPSPTTPPTACITQFSDVLPGNPFYPFVQCLACRSLINGYVCGGTGEPCDANNRPYYRTSSPSSRGQIAKIVSNSAGFFEPAGDQDFQDLPPGSTFYNYAWRLATRGYITGYDCGGPGEPCIPPLNLPYFRPLNPATRAQLAKIIANAAGFTDQPFNQQYQDVVPGSTFYPFIYRLAIRDIIDGYLCGAISEPCIPPDNRPYFRPGNNVTRGQTAKIVSNTFFPNCQTP